MKQLLHNNILKKGILGIFLLFVLLLPVSLSFNVSTLDAGINLSVVNHVAHAAGDGLSLFSWGAGALDDLMNKIGYIMLTFASLFTWAGGITLDFTIEKLVLGMGKMLGGSLGRSVDDIWALVRDISNLAFIFGFIYIGISTILDPEKSSTKKVLAQIIIGALLINFSLFFVKFITDFANLTTVKIYNTMTNGGTGGISITLAEKLGILSIYTEAKPEALAAVAGSSGLPYYIMASIFMVTAGFVFAAGAALLISRFVTLIFIMIASPILFAATAFPQTEHHASALWKKLFDTAFFAPAYLILIFISIKFLDGLKIVTGKTSFTGALMDPMGDSAAVILQFVVMIFFMVQALLIANKFSLTGSEMVISKTKSLIGASTAGLAARSGRATLGRLGNYVSKNEDLLDAAAHRRGVAGFMARSALKTSRVAADASFDGRNTALGKKADVGEGRKGGWVSVKKEVEEKEHKFAKSLGEIDEKDELVKRRSDAITSAETRLKAAKDTFAKAGKGTPEEKSAGLEIEKIEKEVKKAKELYSHEKNRRILGSSFSSEENASAITEAKKKHDALQADIKKSWKEYEEITDADERDLAKGIIQTMEAQAKKAKKELALIQAQRGDGYAKGLEESTRINSWPTGRLAVHNQEAGKAIRKATIKNSGKTDEEIRNEKLIEAVKASKS